MTPFTWALLTAITWGFVPVIEKLGLVKLNPMVGLFYRCLGVIFGIVFLLLLKGQEIRSSFAQLHGGMALLIGGGFLASVVGQIFFYNALKAGEASKVVPLAAAYPLVSFILGVLFLSEKVSAAKITGLFLIVLGIFFLK
jgi:bacterial/archaeal transporter family protein